MDFAYVVGFLIGLAINYLVGNGIAKLFNKYWHLDLSPLFHGLLAVFAGIFVGPIATCVWALYKHFTE